MKYLESMDTINQDSYQLLCPLRILLVIGPRDLEGQTIQRMSEVIRAYRQSVMKVAPRLKIESTWIWKISTGNIVVSLFCYTSVIPPSRHSDVI